MGKAEVSQEEMGKSTAGAAGIQALCIQEKIHRDNVGKDCASSKSDRGNPGA
jgi:hypothetical protein